MRKCLMIIALFFYSCKGDQSSQGEGFLSKVDQTNLQDDSPLLTFFEGERSPIEPAFINLPSGSTRPKGWMLEIMENDLQKGMVGALDELYPGIKSDDLFN
ncbi:MAG: hypothetical protein HRT61_22440 [Ekhidna sp.]|nr:hypothetical protein [Ekhidna sp.]